jgi:hypothetical protein
VSTELPREEWDFRDVPSAELKAALIWEAARESEALTRDHSLLERLPWSPGTAWLSELRVHFGRALSDSDFLGGPWMYVSLLYRWWLHQKIQDVHAGGHHYWLPHWVVDEPIQVDGPLNPEEAERRGREKATGWQAWLRAIGVRRLRRKGGLTVGQIVELYKSVGIVGRDVERAIKRDASEVDGYLRKLLPSVFALEASHGSRRNRLVEPKFLLSLT